MNFEEPPVTTTTCDTCRYIAEQGEALTAMDAYGAAVRGRDVLRARVEELEHRLALAIAKELRIRSMLQECIRMIADEHLEGARVAERLRAELAGQEEGTEP
jgi:hypothetical protein